MNRNAPCATPHITRSDQLAAPTRRASSPRQLAAPARCCQAKRVAAAGAAWPARCRPAWPAASSAPATLPPVVKRPARGPPNSPRQRGSPARRSSPSSTAHPRSRYGQPLPFRCATGDRHVAGTRATARVPPLDLCEATSPPRTRWLFICPRIRQMQPKPSDNSRILTLGSRHQQLSILEAYVQRRAERFCPR
jgi:hypothetical protein